MLLVIMLPLQFIKNGTLDNNLTVEKLDIDGQVATTISVKSLRFNAKDAGTLL